MSQVSAIANSTTTLQTPSTVETGNSSIPLDSFPYIIPYGQKQKCDIYRPMCHTGSITVGVGDESATKTTTLPYSSYLTAQSAFLVRDDPGHDPLLPFYPGYWAQGFGHSPECASYAEVWQRGGQYTFSDCDVTSIIVEPLRASDIPLPSQIPPGVVRLDLAEIYNCCGNCSLQISEVRLYDFPNDAAISSCRKNRSSARSFESTTSVLGNSINKRVHSIVSTASTAVLSGRTL